MIQIPQKHKQLSEDTNDFFDELDTNDFIYNREKWWLFE